MERIDVRSWVILALIVGVLGLLLAGNGGQRDLDALLDERNERIKELQSRIDARADSISLLEDSVLFWIKHDQEREREVNALRLQIVEQRAELERVKGRAQRAARTAYDASDDERLQRWREYFDGK